MDKISYDGPIVLAILDGVGLTSNNEGNAVSKARTPFLGWASREFSHIALDASGEAVGLVKGQIGNSEVGHNTIGTGQITKRGIARFREAFSSGEVFESEAWKTAILRVLSKENNRGEIDENEKIWYNEEIRAKTLHFSGIFSDGGVHSDIAELEEMVEKAYEAGVKKMRVHAVFDGRDVAPQSAEKYIREFEEFCLKFKDADIKIASGGGRMTTVADRYENDWSIVERGFRMMFGEAKEKFRSAEEAIKEFRRREWDIQDQYLPAFIIVDETGEPVGKIEKGDALIYFDFRADRAVEIAQAFTEVDFTKFNRGDFNPNDVYFVGMTEYNTTTHVPEHRLVEPDRVEKTLSRFLGEREISDLAISETVKFGHITYFFNGNSYEKAKGEDSIEIESYTEPFETRPWMRAAEITDKVIENLGKYKFIRINYPGGDMVGHTAKMEATIIAMEAIDLQLRRIYEEVKERGGILIITADHGNAEELLDENGEPKTMHTTNQVPCIICDETGEREKYEIKGGKFGLANLASTMAILLGQEDYPEEWVEPIIRRK